MTTQFVLCALITVISAAVSLGYSLVALGGTTEAVRIAADYAFARSAALFLVSGATFLVPGREWLMAAASAMIIVQTCDAVIGATIRDRLKTFGPAFTAAANLAALIWLAKS